MARRNGPLTAVGKIQDFLGLDRIYAINYALYDPEIPTEKKVKVVGLSVGGGVAISLLDGFLPIADILAVPGAAYAIYKGLVEPRHLEAAKNDLREGRVLLAPWTGGHVRFNPDNLETDNLIHILALLRAIDWISLNAHWKAQGATSYSDHLLFERVYKSNNKSTDAWAERLVGFGVPFNDETVFGRTHDLISGVHDYEGRLEQLIALEEQLTAAISTALEWDPGAGMTSFLEDLADKSQEITYLLEQRRGGVNARPNMALSEKGWVRAMTHEGPLDYRLEKWDKNLPSILGMGGEQLLYVIVESDRPKADKDLAYAELLKRAAKGSKWAQAVILKLAEIRAKPNTLREFKAPHVPKSLQWFLAGDGLSASQPGLWVGYEYSPDALSLMERIAHVDKRQLYIFFSSVPPEQLPPRKDNYPVHWTPFSQKVRFKGADPLPPIRPGQLWAKIYKGIGMAHPNGMMPRRETRVSALGARGVSDGHVRWPIDDIGHARLALRYMKMGRGNKRDYPAIRKAISRRAREMGWDL